MRRLRCCLLAATALLPDERQAIFALVAVPTRSVSGHCCRRCGSSVTARHKSLHFQTTVDNDLTSLQKISNRLDPLLASFLLRSVRSTTKEDDDDTNYNQFTFTDATNAMVGLQVWEMSLRKGRLPISTEDFIETKTWPDAPLFFNVYTVLSEMGISRLVRCHPTILTSVLLSVAKIVIEYNDAQRRGKLVLLEDASEDAEYHTEIDMNDTSQFGYEPLSAEELAKLADSVANGLKLEWGAISQGITQLDKIFGYDHGLLDLQGGESFGLQDGIWKHSGWKPLPDLQRRISSMPELRDLLSQLGRRPSVEGKDNRLFRPRRRSNSNDDMKSVDLDPLDPTSVTGLNRSGSLSYMLPSEAVLLRSSTRSLRWLFLAKFAESTLLSYELSGWVDVHTLPPRRPRRSKQLPSAAGGPLIICLDTSHSMSGNREMLSKAVVVASVTAAIKQGRDCRVVSFSSASNSVECGNISCDASGINTLLDFLSYSFGGGTDVTGALVHAMDVLQNDLTSSDLLLVTDGELPNPPVSNAVLAKLEELKRQTGMEIHGLLIGKRESESLNMLCNQVHNFLGSYDAISAVATPYTGVRRRSPTAPSTIKSSSHFKRSTRRYSRMALHSMSQSDDLTDRQNNSHVKLRKRVEGARTKRRFDDDDEIWDLREDETLSWRPSKSSNGVTSVGSADISEYDLKVESALELVQGTASQEVERSKLFKSEIDISWSKSIVITETISYIERGLVERGLEARLVVLGMISNEHVLFIGPPGTSKSEIGRRLSTLCGGPFFQRLFTRFTTPEEIFGPLSLQALEKDLYIRCTQGFLPTATVAFLDEIFKANSAILNSLLTILNERMFDNGAGTRVSCPLKCVIGASNELPDSEELDALLDRFLLRSYVTSVSDDGLMQILSAQSSTSVPEFDSSISDKLEEVIVEISNALNSVTIDQGICILLRDMRTFLRDELDIYVSDRRLVKASNLLKVSAASHGRKRVDFIDCLLLQHVIWQYPDQRQQIREWLFDNMTPGTADDLVEQTLFLLRGLGSESFELVKKTMGDVDGNAGARELDLEAIKSVQNELEVMAKLLQQNSNELERHRKLLDNLQHHLWTSRDEAQSAKQQLLPMADKAIRDVNQALVDTISLKLALSPTTVSDEIRSSVIQALTNQNDDDTTFSDEELQMSLKEAKRMYQGSTLSKWKSARRDLELK